MQTPIFLTFFWIDLKQRQLQRLAFERTLLITDYP